MDIINQFINKKLVEEAFVHRSCLNETNKKLRSNERLEFLGDAVLELIVSEHLFQQFSDFPEGKLTLLRSSIVRTETLAEVASNLKLGNHLLLGRGEEEGGGRNNTSILANTFEALLGAIYLDRGYLAAKEFVKTYLFLYIEKIIEKKLYLDAKSFLQEKVQEKMKVTPIYQVLSEEGPDHQKIFKVAVFADKQKLGEGIGKNKQEAEQQAAQNALERNRFY